MGAEDEVNEESGAEYRDAAGWAVSGHDIYLSMIIIYVLIKFSF